MNAEQISRNVLDLVKNASTAEIRVLAQALLIERAAWEPEAFRMCHAGLPEIPAVVAPGIPLLNTPGVSASYECRVLHSIEWQGVGPAGGMGIRVSLLEHEGAPATVLLRTGQHTSEIDWRDVPDIAAALTLLGSKQ